MNRLLPIGGSSPERILMVNPPIYDTRLHWVQWLQPTTLLGMASFCRASGSDVRLFDSLHVTSDQPLRRKRVAVLNLDGIAVNKWRFGLPSELFVRYLGSLVDARWVPDVLCVECLTTFWWEGAVEAVDAVKAAFPNVRVVVVGGYGRLAPDHVREHLPDAEVISDLPKEVGCCDPDFSLYETLPRFSYLTTAEGTRTASDIVDTLERLARTGIRHFAFSDHDLVRRFPELHREFIEKVASRELNVAFYSLGNIAASDIAGDPDLIDAMKQAGYKQIWYSDDRDIPPQIPAHDDWLDAHRAAAELCTRAGFRPRTGELTASLSIGRAGEDIEERTAAAALLAHTTGSVSMWPYQPLPVECPDLPLEETNGKLFPFRSRNQASYEDYLRLLGLAAILNAKYRQRTFDFSGDGLILLR